MADIVDAATRSRMMSGIRGRNTSPELTVRKHLHRLGFRYRLHVRGLPGVPDIVLPRHHATIFVHGCFWHRHRDCKFATMPSSRRSFWKNKLEGNAKRDRRNVASLRRNGWRVYVVWECRLTPIQLDRLANRILGRPTRTIHRPGE